MSKLRNIEQELVLEIRQDKPLSLEKITLYLEVILMVVQFIMGKGLVVDGKMRKISWWHFSLIGSLIALFRDIVRKLTNEEEG